MSKLLTKTNNLRLLAIRSLTMFILLSPQVNAAETLSVNDIMQLSGLNSQLDSLSVELQSTINQAMSECNVTPEKNLPSSLKERYSSERLRHRASLFLTNELDHGTLLAVSTWYRSNHGQLIAEAELAASYWTEEKFDQRIASLLESSDWNKDRKNRVSKVISATDAHKYVASLTTSVTELTTLVKRCSIGISLQSRNEAITRIENDRDLTAMFVRMELLQPSAAVFESVPDLALDEYRLFASSPEGQFFHATLVSVFENILLSADWGGFVGLDANESNAKLTD